MRILFVNRFYAPDLAATAQRLGELAEHLAERGHDVRVLCSQGSYDTGTGGALPRREVLRGVGVRRLAGFDAGKSSRWRRLMDYVAFHILAGCWVLTRGGRFDAVVTLTTPPLIGVYGAILRLLTGGRTRHIAWTMDLHPDAEFELGLLSRRNPLWRFLDALNSWQLRKADGVVALGERMKERIVEKGVADERVAVVPMWHDAGHGADAPPGRSRLRAEQGWNTELVVMYSGNAGLVHTFDAVCEVMRRLDGDPRFRFVFVGSGKRMREVTGFAQRHKLRSYTHLPYVPDDQLSDTLAAADVHLVTLRDGMSGVAVPCKLYGIMAAGRPVVYVGPGDSDTAQHIRESDAGVVLGTGDHDGLAATLARLAGDAPERRRLGDNGRRVFTERFERDTCCKLWSNLLEAWFPAARGAAGRDGSIIEPPTGYGRTHVD